MEWNDDLQQLYKDVQVPKHSGSNSSTGQHASNLEAIESTVYLQANERQLGINKSLFTDVDLGFIIPQERHLSLLKIMTITLISPFLSSQKNLR